jgi:hypothetical protein
VPRIAVDVYEHSGKAAVGPALGASLGAIALAAVAAFPYQAMQDAGFLQLLHFLLPPIFGLGCGFLVALVVRVGKFRSRGLSLAVLLATVLAGDVASFDWAYRADTLRFAAANLEIPSFSEWVRFRVGAGWIQSSASDRVEAEAAKRRPPPPPEPGPSRTPNEPVRVVRGVEVPIAWTVEALAMVGVALLVLRFRRSGPFCEDCLEWSVPLSLRPVSSASTQTLRVALRDGDLRPLLDPPRSDRAGVSARRTLHRCPRCDAAWLDVGYSVEGGGASAALSVGHWLVRGVVLTPSQRSYLEDREDDVDRRRDERGPPSGGLKRPRP